MGDASEVTWTFEKDSFSFSSVTSIAVPTRFLLVFGRNSVQVADNA